MEGSPLSHRNSIEKNQCTRERKIHVSEVQMLSQDYDIVCVIYTEAHTPELFFFFFRAAGATYGSSQARGAATASLQHSQSNTRSELLLRPIPQSEAMLDP